MRRHGGGPTPVLSADERERLEGLVWEHNDDTLDQLRQRGDLPCSRTTIWWALRRRRWTRK